MSWVKKFSCFLIILSALTFSGRDAYALNVFKFDISRICPNFGTWVQKQQENFENAMKEITESQFAVFIGKGIEAAKKGIAFAKEKMEEAKALFNKVKETIDAVKNSTEYKIAMLSVEAATQTAVLDTMKKDRDKQKAELKSEYEVQKVTLEEKIKAAEENYNIGLEVLTNELNELENEEELKIKREEMKEFRNANRASIDQMKAELEALTEKSKEDIKAVEVSFAASILTQTTVIAGIGIEIADLVEQKKREKGQLEKDPEKVMENAANEISYKEGEVITLEKRQKKEKTRKRKRAAAATASSGYSAGIISNVEQEKEDEQQNAEMSGTMNGKSEALQTAISQTIVQLDSLYNYLLLELKSIEAETLNLMSENKDYKFKEMSPAINICNYEMEGGGFLDGLNELKDAAGGVVDQAKGAVDQAKGAVSGAIDKAKGAVETAKGAVDTAKGAVDAAKGAVENVSNTVEGMSENPADAVSGLTGM